MKSRLFIMVSLFALTGIGTASAQTAGVPQTDPYGYSPGETARPYEAPARDENGNRIVINGQLIGSGTSNPARSGGSLASRGGSTLPSGGTLGGASINAVSIGNSVNIQETYNSTIIINQTNNANQTVNVNGTPADEDQ